MWLDNDNEKSWQKLATALKQCDYSLMAEKIKGMHKIPVVESVRYFKHIILFHHDNNSYFKSLLVY